MMLKTNQLSLLCGGIAAILCLIPVSGFSKDKATPARIQGSISIQGKDKSDYPSLAKLSLQDAIALVSKLHPGKVTEVSLDKEDGFLVYEFEIVDSGHEKKEVLIDAGTGKTLRVKDQKGHQDDDEDESEND